MNIFKKATFMNKGAGAILLALLALGRPRRRTQRSQPPPMDNPHSTRR